MRWWERAWAIANTPLDGRALRSLIVDLIASEDAGALWRSPVGEVWERIKVVPAGSTAVESEPVAIRRSMQAEALYRLTEGVFDAAAFNAWRREHGMRPLMLAKADLRNRDLQGADLTRCILFGADLRGADLRGCRLEGAVLKNARIAGAVLDEATLAGHDLEELADALEDQEFHKWIRSLRKQDLQALVGVSEQDRKYRKRAQVLQWDLKFHNSIRRPLKLKVWLDNGIRSDLVAEMTLDPLASKPLTVEIERKKYPPEKPLAVALFIEGVNAPIRRLEVWAWERSGR